MEPLQHRGRLTLSRTSSSPSASARSSSSDSPSAAAAGISQSLSSILNNPHAPRSDSSWAPWWTSSSSAPPPPLPLDPLPTSLSLAAAALPAISLADLLPYLSSISEPYARFHDVRRHAATESAALHDPARGDALVACLREVPALFSKEDFALEEGDTFRAACPFSPSIQDNAALQERLGQYLDTVETHLVREIALRSDSFFEAQGRLQGLDVEIVGACCGIGELRESIRLLSHDLVGSARQVQELNATRDNLVALQEKLTLILYVNQELSALKLLVSAADCAGALDITDDLRHLVNSDELVGLQCFRHLQVQLGESTDSVNSILSAEFLRVAIHDIKSVDSMILLKFKTRRMTIMNGLENEVKADEDEGSILRDGLIPLIICLVRTTKLPSVLRVYRDTLITEMKTAIKTTVAELLPLLVMRSLESDLMSGERTADTDGSSSSLGSKLKSLSSDSFLQLLAAIFKVVQAHLLLAADVKGVVEWIMGNLELCFRSDPVTGVPTIVTEVGLDCDDQTISNDAAFVARNTSKTSLFQEKTNEISSPYTSKNLRADVLRENTEAVFAACDAAQGRWAKLLSVRATFHSKLKLKEFSSIYDITQEFITSTEKIGGRLGYSIRGTLQSQSKLFIANMHASQMEKIRAVLDQETWNAVDVPDEFQTIVTSILSSDVTLENIHISSEASESHCTNIVADVSVPDANIEKQVSTASHGSDVNHNAHGKSTAQKLVFGGVGYHMVNCGLILLKMLSECIDTSRCLPVYSLEVGRHLLELLRFFNTRTCQLVLGAGAMQVSGLKSITSKHLALASQLVSFVYAMIPEIRRTLSAKISEPNNGILLSEIDKVAQDYRIHRDEIHNKLVQIMRERLLVNLRKLPQIVQSWNISEDNDLQPSQFAKAVTKEVTYLHRILSQILLANDVQAIFRQVVQIFHSHISEAFSCLELDTLEAKNRLCCDAQHILGCIRKLPSDVSNNGHISNFGLLDEFLDAKFGAKVSLYASAK